MTANQLGIDIVRDVCHSEFTGIGGNLSMKHNLHEYVSEFLTQMIGIVRLDTVESLVRLLDHVLTDTLMRLLAIPRASIGLAQAPNGIDQVLKLGARIDMRFHVPRPLGILRCH